VRQAGTPARAQAKAQAKGGRGWRRALPHLLPWALVLAGAATAAQAAWIPLKAQLAQVLLDRAFAESVERGEPVKPWNWADTAPLARVSVERLGVGEVVLSGGSGEAMAFGPTALVDGGPARVTVLAAHRDTHFRFVRDLRAGDAIALERIDGSVARYRVRSLSTVRWDRFAYPAGGSTELLALATCYPFDSDRPGPLRRIAWAERVG